MKLLQTYRYGKLNNIRIPYSINTIFATEDRQPIHVGNFGICNHTDYASNMINTKRYIRITKEELQ